MFHFRYRPPNKRCTADIKEFAINSEDLFSSPRIASLRKDLEKGDIAALDNFWSEVHQLGTPLVESIPDDEEYVLVTFLWQGTPDTTNVVVRNDDIRWTNITGNSGIRENAMTNLSGNMPT